MTSSSCETLYKDQKLVFANMVTVVNNIVFLKMTIKIHFNYFHLSIIWSSVRMYMLISLI